MNFFTFDGKSSVDFGVYIGGQQTYGAPARSVTKTQVPGRNGDVIRDNGRWMNVTIAYNVVVMDQFEERTRQLNAWLANTRGYKRLVDTYHPEYFRMAAFNNSIEYDTKSFNASGRTQIQFDCKPQKFLFSGEDPYVYTGSEGMIFNPTEFDSKPLIKMLCDTGGGSVTVNGCNIVFSESGIVVIDSELQDCYNNDGTVNLNNKVTLTNDKFPVLKPGKNVITISSGVLELGILGRWFEI